MSRIQRAESLLERLAEMIDYTEGRDGLALHACRAPENPDQSWSLDLQPGDHQAIKDALALIRIESMKH